jgi:uncharacterized protein
MVSGERPTARSARAQRPTASAASGEIPTSQGPARVDLDGPAGGATPSFLLALTHGAGGTVSAPDLLAVRDVGVRLGGAVALITQPYRVRGARAPGNAARQDDAWREIIESVRISGIPLIQGGRSNGARVACRTARSVGAAGVIALAFPLRPPGRRVTGTRDGELREAASAGADVLVLNGDRDPFGIPDADQATRVVILPGETHSLSRNPEAVSEAVAAWLSDLLPKAR